jgi:glycine/D-amino acid oxidase-like deaminating enzyme
MRATRCSWAWINANSKRPHSYQALNHLAMQMWEAMLPGFVSWCGALLLNGSPPQELPDYSFTPLYTADDVLELEPALSREYLERLSSACPAAHFPQEGLVDPQEAVAHLIQQAQARGATFIYGTRVHGFPWDVEGDVTGVECSHKGGRKEQVRADVVVLANGTGVQRLARAAGVRIPMLHKPGVLTWLRPGKEVCLRRIVLSEELHMLQRTDGLVAVGESKETGGASSTAFVVRSGAAAGERGGSGEEEEGGEEVEVEHADGLVEGQVARETAVKCRA